MLATNARPGARCPEVYAAAPDGAHAILRDAMRLSPRSLPVRTALAAALVSAAAAPRAAAGQDYRLASGFSLSAGAADYSSARGNATATIAVRGDAELTRWLVGELGVSALRPDEGLGSRLTYVVPELQLQLQLRAGALRPYVGGGGGWFYAIGPDRDRRSAFSLSAAGGVRVDLRDVRWGLRAEARARGIDREFSRTVSELTGGVVFRF